MKRIFYCLMVALCLAVGGPSTLFAQVSYYSIQRQKWLSQLATNPVPVAYRFSTLSAGLNLQRAEVSSSAATNALEGGGYQMSYATNMAAYILTETNLTGGLNEFNALYPTGPYRLLAEYKLLSVPRTQIFTPQLTNDFAAVDPIFTDPTPLLSLQTNQTFNWPVFTSDTNSFARFFLLEGNIDTNVLASLIADGLEGLTNQLAVLAWYLKLPPAQNSLTVSNLNPLLDHLAVLEFYNVSPTGSTIPPNEVASISANATFFFALRILADPQSQTVEEGEVVTLSVVAVGARPLQYQWRFNGADLPGATNLLWVIPEAKKTHAGLYSVVVGNPSGSITSQVAMLTVTNASPPESFHLEEAGTLGSTFYFLVIGEEGATYAIEASETLTNWTSIGRLSTPLGAAYYFDTNVVLTFPHRFYRARKE